MKGYLERLAASASRPQSRLRPMVGSIFAKSPREQNGDVALPLVFEQSAEEKSEQPLAHAERVRSTQEVRANNSENHPHPQDSTDENPAPFTPLLPARDIDSKPGVLRMVEPFLDSQVHPNLDQPQFEAPRPVRIEEERPERKRRIVPEPLVVRPLKYAERNEERSADTGGLPVNVHPREVEPLIKAIARVERADSREMVRATRVPERSETEEIQIHIGRIEVIAVPPPNARSTAAPANRSTSLDDYLKRPGGRAR